MNFFMKNESLDNIIKQNGICTGISCEHCYFGEVKRYETLHSDVVDIRCKKQKLLTHIVRERKLERILK